MVLGKVKSLTISFDCLSNSNIPVYSSGDTVSGSINLEVTGEIRVKALKIHARGHAKVHWSESRNAGSNTAYTQNYTEEVEYFNHKDVLVGHARDDDNSEEGLHTIHSGRHEYAFSFELPQMIGPLHRRREENLCHLSPAEGLRYLLNETRFYWSHAGHQNLVITA